MNDAERVTRMTEWIEVRRKGGHKVVAPPSSGFSNPLDRSATIESITKQLRKQRQAWKIDPSRAAVYRVLQNLYISDGPPVSTAICLAVGSLSRENLECRKRSMAQLAAFLDLVDHLSSNTGTAITIYAQDPAFTTLDEEVLQSLGVAVLQADSTGRTIGQASKHFGGNAFVAEFYMDLSPDTTAQLLKSNTRLLITTVQSQIERFQRSADHSTIANVLKSGMDEEYTRFAFPTTTTSQDFLAFEGLNLLALTPKDEVAN